MDEKISAFLTDVIPNEIPKRRRRKLVDELSCHIEDRADAFREIGYSDEESVSKALEAFAETDETKKSISNSFDGMYHERTVWAFVSFFAVLIVNLLCCVPLQIFVFFSPDYFNAPTVFSSAVSFAFIFAIFAAAGFLKKKRYKKTLTGLAAGIGVIAVSFYQNYIFQAASFTVAANIVCLTDFVFGGSAFGNTGLFKITCTLCAVLEYVFSISAILFCAVCTVRTKRGENGSEKTRRKKSAVFTAVLAALAIMSVMMLPRSRNCIFERKTDGGHLQTSLDRKNPPNRSEII